MGAFMVRRLLNYVVLVFVATSLAYLGASTAFHPKDMYLQKNPPTKPVVMYQELNERNENPEKPVFERYAHWVDGVAHGDFGKTWQLDSVNKHFSISVWVTVRLVSVAAVLSAILGILIGSFQAVRQYKFSDHAITFGSYIVFAMPVFVLAPLLKLIAVQVNKAVGGDTPFLQYQGEIDPNATGFWGQLFSRADHLLLPTISLTLGLIAFYSRYQRGQMLDVLGSDFLRTARAKGLTKGRAILKHGVRTAVIPVMTLVTYSTILTFAGAIITERVFGWNGLGSWFTDATNHSDVNSVAVITLFSAVLVLVAGMLSDVITALLDPRVRL
ncbi:ABC transporter permease [Catenulispora rubra]|uniref:ABC transporter permease n=1 Tax=Catenulispora rubra TaxID=280293 RepID=UPI00189209BE|nr:ABC transporter permease [Catenulispora rubra]